MANSDLPIVLFHYHFSPYARRIVWYLNLRGIPYTQCLQPPMLPRPDLAVLGISYRRIPLLSIGRDVYADTRLIIPKLEELYPPSAAHPSISSSESNAHALERLLSRMTTDGALFSAAASLMPPSLPVLRDRAWLADRADFVGIPRSAAAAAGQQKKGGGGGGGPSPFSPEALAARRPEALATVRDAVEFLETGLLADGRDWILGTEGPSLADIEAVWPLHWLTTMPGALDPEAVGLGRYPKVFGWIERFGGAVEEKGRAVGKPRTVKGPEAAKIIVGSGFAEEEVRGVDDGEAVVKAQGLKKGDLVVVSPTDSGTLHPDSGPLIAFSARQIVVETEGPAGKVRLHVPRQGFKVRKERQGGSKL